jgi:LmbE family N-acetylglucosaminyl deacetylase
VALAVVAHPDDIEFMMAGTLLLLKEAGCEIHLWNLSRGNAGTGTLGSDEISALRLEEARAAAAFAGGVHHPPMFDDLGIFYDAPSLARVASVVREINPGIILTHSPQDYMEDHQNSSRLIVSAAFSKEMRNFVTVPDRVPAAGNTAIYHALPHGLRGSLREPIPAEFFVNIESVIDAKRGMLACHRSQSEWLRVSQGMDSYVEEMEDLSRRMGSMSGIYTYAEGWRRHSHLGFAAENFDPVRELLTASLSVI